MNLKKIVSNSEQRFKTIESKNFKEWSLNFPVDLIKPIIRGTLIGGALGYVIGGDLESVKVFAKAGLLFDVGSENLRLYCLSRLYGKNKEKYNQYKDSKLRII